MDNIEREEVNYLLKKYQCDKEANVILSHLLGTNRINKAALSRSGYKDENINAMVTRLRLALEPYGGK